MEKSGKKCGLFYIEKEKRRMNKWKRPQGKTAEWQFAKTVNKKEEDMKTIIAEKPSVAREIAR
ncbi:hypothetical protein, partial [Parasutterella excrementihominis]|uniref:hypothetical protein n=1 Tax=Parasutterella excrementihominis TaxID=487175 RepID=UPI00242C5714